VSSRTDYPVTVEHPTSEHYEHAHGNFCGLCMKTWPCQAPVIPDPSPDMRSALIGLDDELRRLHGAPHNVEDHGLAHAWVVARAALFPAGSRVELHSAFRSRDRS